MIDWSVIHPSIVDQSQRKFEDGYFADSVESALKEVNHRIRVFVETETGEERDGASVMSTFECRIKAR